jgi:integrase
MSNRDAKPLSEKAMSAFHDACIEEIRQGKERYGIPALLGLHTGLRRRLIVHFREEWLTEQRGNDAIQTPKELPCKIKEGGCSYCNDPRSGGPDGYVRPKTGNSEQRTIPIFDTWYDYHLDKKRDTELAKWLNHWYTRNDGAGWGYEKENLGNVIKIIAKRRHDVISENHEGEEERWLEGRKQTIPDIITHDLRATWATQCLRTGVDDTTLMDWAGWKSVDMVSHYRGFIEDPEGTERKKYEEGRKGSDDDSNNTDVDMAEVVEVYSKITEGETVNPAEYDNAVLEAAYEMIEAS